MVGIGLPMAMGGGTLYALAATGVSYFAEKGKRTGVPLTAKQNFALEFAAFCTYIVGGLVATAAYAMGDPVPLLQGALVATNLILVMAFQIGLGISVYTKSMRIGTILVFVVVMFQLAEVGPEPRGDDVDIKAMFAKTSAISWFIALVALLIGTGFGMVSTLSQPSESFTKIFMWALHLAVWGSVTDNAASTFGVIKGALLYAAFGAYALVSVYILGLSSRAPAVCDANTFVPLNLSLQLVFNMITGFLVWEDSTRMNGKSTMSYLVTFVVIILGVYVASPSADLVESIVRWRVLKTTTLSKEMASSVFGKAVLELVQKWRDVKREPCKETEDAAKRALSHALSVGSERGRISPEMLVSLAVELYNGDAGSFAFSAGFMRWLDSCSYFQEYFRLDPAFRDNMIQLLSERELNKLTEIEKRNSFRESFLDVATSELSIREH